ncbi:hypothetical protein GYH30_049880 [Glycine max]|uniref:Uncharacterized protein n=1 Tax=Glycine max TaxID=3847 RepID=A0A0R0F952_SOYBN|nr:hypothetical protein GYH30_049880 [Glycine max]
MQLMLVRFKNAPWEHRKIQFLRLLRSTVLKVQNQNLILRVQHKHNFLSTSTAEQILSRVVEEVIWNFQCWDMIMNGKIYWWSSIDNY